MLRHPPSSVVHAMRSGFGSSLALPTQAWIQTSTPLGDQS